MVCRSKLMEEVTSNGVLNTVQPEIVDLYKLLEFEYDPLFLCRRVDEILKTIESKQIPLSAGSPVKQIKIEQYT